jgi:hypothetical protein
MLSLNSMIRVEPLNGRCIKNKRMKKTDGIEDSSVETTANRIPFSVQRNNNEFEAVAISPFK